MSSITGKFYPVVDTTESGDLYPVIRGGQLKKQTREALLTATKDAALKAARNGGPTTNRPTAPEIFEQYFDTTINRLIIWNGMSWVNDAGVTA